MIISFLQKGYAADAPTLLLSHQMQNRLETADTPEKKPGPTMHRAWQAGSRWVGWPYWIAGAQWWHRLLFLMSYAHKKPEHLV